MDDAGLPKQRVNISPGPAVLSVLRHLNYKPWYALAEFVDNAVQSYNANKAALHALHGPKWRLRVSIDIDAAAPVRISIRDNVSNGIELGPHIGSQSGPPLGRFVPVIHRRDPRAAECPSRG